MSNLDNIIAKISEDAKKTADEIKREAENKKDILIKSRVDQANQKKEEILLKTERDQENLENKKISSAKLKARDIKLKAKQDVIDNVLDRVKSKLENLDDETYHRFVEKSLEKMNLQPTDELILQKGRDAKSYSGVTISDKTVNSGFEIKRGDVLLNNDFSNIIDSKKDDLEVEIVKKLFV